MTPLPRRAWAALAAVFAALLIWLLPTLPAFQSPAERADRAVVKKTGERLVRIAKAAERPPGAARLDAAGKAAAKLAKLGQQMQGGRMPRRKALMKLAKLTGEIKQAQQALAMQTGDPNGLGAGKSLAAAGRDLQKALDAALKSDPNRLSPGLKVGADGRPNDPQSSEAQKSRAAAMRAVQKALAQNNAPSLADQLRKLADAASRGEPGDQAGRESLAAQLEALGKSLEGTSLKKASDALAEAARALRNGNTPKAAEKLREAAKKAAEAGIKSDDARALSEMAEALQGSPEGEGTEQQVSGDQMAEAASGENAGDAFGADGMRKGDKGASGSGEGQAKNGQSGEGGEPGNGIGTGAGKPGGERTVGKSTGYADARDAPSGNKFLNRAMQKTPLTSEKGQRLMVPTGNTTRIAGKRGEKGREMVTYTRGAPDRASASVPYYEVYGKYAPAAEKALSREDIPATYKKQVKDYFDALQPSEKP